MTQCRRSPNLAIRNTKTTSSARQSVADSYHKNSEKGSNMTDKQPEALRLADTLEEPLHDFPEPTTLEAEAAAELRRQYAEIETLRTGYEAARLEIESLRGKGWQPIETAPKDGALILAAIHIHCSDGTAAWQRHAIYFDAERNITYTDGGDETGWDFDDYQYWMPLPAAPGITKRGQHG